MLAEATIRGASIPTHEACSITAQSRRSRVSELALLWEGNKHYQWRKSFANPSQIRYVPAKWVRWVKFQPKEDDAGTRTPRKIRALG